MELTLLTIAVLALCALAIWLGRNGHETNPHRDAKWRPAPPDENGGSGAGCCGDGAMAVNPLGPVSVRGAARAADPEPASREGGGKAQALATAAAWTTSDDEPRDAA